MVAQAVLLAIYISGAAWVFGLQPRLRKRRVQPAAEARAS
jgi:hypothetical protein